MPKDLRVHTLDVLKMIAAFFVCYQHACGTGCFSEFFLSVSRTAVPIFVMITGYFYKGVVERKRESKQIKKILIIAIEMGALWLLIDSIYHFMKHDLISYWRQIVSFDSIKRFVLFNDPAIADHAWYLWALIYVLVLIVICPQLIRFQWLRWLTIICAYVLLLLFGQYSFIVGKSFPYYYVRNAFLEVLPFFLVGTIIRELDEKGRVPDNRRCCVIITICIVFQLIEFLILKSVNPEFYTGIGFLTMPTAVAFLLTALCNKKAIDSNSIFAVIGNKYSLFIYAIHPIFVRVEKKVIDMNSIYQYVGVVAVFVVSLLLGILYYKTLKKNRIFRNVF